MCYGYGVNDYALGVGYGYQQAYGAPVGGNMSIPQIPPSQQIKPEVNEEAYKSKAKNDDSSAKVGALILSAAVIGGLIFKGGSSGEKIKKASESAEQILKNAKDKVDGAVTKLEEAAEKLSGKTPEVKPAP